MKNENVSKVGEMEKGKITKDQFESYVRVQKSGVTNMFDIRTVTSLTSLFRHQVIEIMENYDKLEKKYNN
tara:strand:+ start:512 stop:721 length:210 start_codon:yes stop_codon:yes gene_type:complete